MDAKTVAAALAGAAQATAQWAGPRAATALVRDALVALSDEDLEDALGTTTGLPSDVAIALAQDRHELATALAVERRRASAVGLT